MTTMMKRAIKVGTTAIALAGLAAMPAQAQGTQDKPAPPPAVASKVDVVISRSLGDKKISSQPYILMPTGDSRGSNFATLRIGVDVPVGTTTTTRPPETNSTGVVTRSGTTTTEPNYRNVGTNIDCQVTNLGNGQFTVMVSVTDSTIFNPDSPNNPGRPGETSAFRTFNARNTLTMRDGQTMLLIAATDKVTGELIKVEVTFNLVK